MRLGHVDELVVEPLLDRLELPARAGGVLGIAVDLPQDDGVRAGQVVRLAHQDLVVVVAGHVDVRVAVVDHAERLAVGLAVVDRHRDHDLGDVGTDLVRVDVDDLVVAVAVAGEVVAVVHDRAVLGRQDARVGVLDLAVVVEHQPVRDGAGAGGVDGLAVRADEQEPGVEVVVVADTLAGVPAATDRDLRLAVALVDAQARALALLDGETHQNHSLFHCASNLLHDSLLFFRCKSGLTVYLYCTCTIFVNTKISNCIIDIFLLLVYILIVM